MKESTIAICTLLVIIAVGHNASMVSKYTTVGSSYAELTRMLDRCEAIKGDTCELVAK